MSEFGVAGHAPLGEVISAVDDVLDAAARRWLLRRGYLEPTVSTTRPGSIVDPHPQLRDQLQELYVAKFALAVGADLRHHQAANLEAARRFGASYTQLAGAVGMSRQGVQKRWGLTDAEQDRARAAIAAAVQKLPSPLSHPRDAAWSLRPDAHNYDPEADLWAAEISIHMATGSSPKQVLLFHGSEFLGPATDASTDHSYGYTRLLLTQSTPKLACVQFELRDPTKPNAAQAAGFYTARYRWTADEVVWFGELPPGASTFATDGRSRPS